MLSIDVFLPYESWQQVQPTYNEMMKYSHVRHLFLMNDLSDHVFPAEADRQKVELLPVQHLFSTETMHKIAAAASADYLLLYLKSQPLKLGYLALERMLQIADDTQAGMLYCDAFRLKEGNLTKHPLIDYQLGSLRDDFDFGSLLLFKTAAFQQAVNEMTETYQWAGWYDLRLRLSQHEPIEHLNELLYTEIETDVRKSGEKLFDYVDPKNRQRQLEMEKACTAHLQAIGAFLPPDFDEISFDETDFSVEASVIIPVYNRAKTIADAVESALNQKTTFPYNVIVIDNHSTDGTTEILRRYKDEPRLLHLIPERMDLGIGGCWNVGVDQPQCGKFAVQLDSDDVYNDENTLQIMVDAFYQQQCGMVVGSYRMTNFQMETIPPGIIDHLEWTDENGRNNALRINGFGAPRAFYTPLLRKWHIPNTSYGEDYALGLKFSRTHRIGRVYDVVYSCRRWDDNSDAALDVDKMNQHNVYKDRIRSWEIKARQHLNAQRKTFKFRS
ncbi:MAG: glycosyltransferase family 2 protein [Microbacter sp.]